MNISTYRIIGMTSTLAALIIFYFGALILELVPAALTFWPIIIGIATCFGLSILPGIIAHMINARDISCLCPVCRSQITILRRGGYLCDRCGEFVGDGLVNIKLKMESESSTRFRINLSTTIVVMLVGGAIWGLNVNNRLVYGDLIGKEFRQYGFPFPIFDKHGLNPFCVCMDVFPSLLILAVTVVLWQDWRHNRQKSNS